jgi:hypothetical protein
MQIELNNLYNEVGVAFEAIIKNNNLKENR